MLLLLFIDADMGRTGAVFLYKRSLLATMQGVDDDTDGIRISIPLQCIDSHSSNQYFDKWHSITLSLSAPSTLDSDDTSSTDSERSIQSVEFVATSFIQCVDGLDAMFEAKKKLLEKQQQQSANDDPYRANRKVIVDYGSLGFPQPSETIDGTPSRSREQAVCDAIGIGASSDVWSACFLPLFSSSSFSFF